MKIGIISDTHNNMRLLHQVVLCLNQEKIDLLIHCGDWEMPFTMRVFADAKFPIKSVLGNGDPDIEKFLYQLQNLESLKDTKIEIFPRIIDMTIDGKRIAVFHGNDEGLNKMILESQFFDVFCLGHSHRPIIKEKGKTLIINPGSLVGYFQEDGDTPRTMAIYDTKTHQAKLINLDKLFKTIRF